MKADIAEKVSGWVCGRISEPSSWVAVAAVLIGLSLVMSALMMSIVGIAAAAGALVIRERGDG